MKIFKVRGSKDTNDVETEIILNFPERVDYVALSGFLNDHHITYQFRFESIDGDTWKAIVRRTGEQIRWIPSIEVLGFQL